MHFLLHLSGSGYFLVLRRGGGLQTLDLKHVLSLVQTSNLPRLQRLVEQLLRENLGEPLLLADDEVGRAGRVDGVGGG